MYVAYFSPLNPVKSGISDFSEELILELKKHMKIDLFTDGFKPSNEDIIRNFDIYSIEDIENAKIRNSYDHLIFHVGNNLQFHEKIVEKFLKYKGILELHDFSLHNFIERATLGRNDINGYKALMQYCHGSQGAKKADDYFCNKIDAPWEYPLEFPMNKHLIDNASAIIVHSDIVKQMIKGIKPNAQVINITLPTIDIIDNYDQYKELCRNKLNIDKDTLVFGSFGFATRAKRIAQILKALGRFKKRNNAKFLAL